MPIGKIVKIGALVTTFVLVGLFVKRSAEVGIGPAASEIGQAVGHIGQGIGSIGAGAAALGQGVGAGISGLFAPFTALFTLFNPQRAAAAGTQDAAHGVSSARSSGSTTSRFDPRRFVATPQQALGLGWGRISSRQRR